MIIGLLASGGGRGRTRLALSLAGLLAEKGEVSLYEFDVAQPKLISFFPFEGESVTRRISKVIPEKCTLVGKCFEVCAFGAIEKGEKTALRKAAFCRGCGLCRQVCPERAIDWEEIPAGVIGKAQKGKVTLYAGQLDQAQGWEGFLVRELKKRYPLNDKPSVLKAPLGLGAESLRTVKEAQAMILVTREHPGLEEEIKVFAEIVQGFGLPAGVVLRAKEIPETINSLASQAGLSVFSLPWVPSLEKETFLEEDPASRKTLEAILGLAGGGS